MYVRAEKERAIRRYRKPETIENIVRMCQNWVPKGYQNGAKMVPKWIQKLSKNRCAKKTIKGRVGIIAFGTLFDQKSIPKSYKKHTKNTSTKNEKVHLKGCQIGSKIRPKSRSKSILKSSVKKV